MKKEKILSILTIKLAIILIALVGIIGIYVKEKNKMVNVVPEFMLARQFTGSREVRLEPEVVATEETEENSEQTVEDNTEEEDVLEDTTVETPEVFKNTAENLNVDNYKISKKIISNRIAEMGNTDYTMSLDESNGNINIKISDKASTDDIIGILSTIRKI